MPEHTVKAQKANQGHDAYPVRTVARLTGLSADLIRAWEKRHGVVTPIRGPRGARLYSVDDVAHLRLLAQAVGGGRAIGDVAQLDRPALEALAGKARAAEPDAAEQIVLARLLDAVGSGDAVVLERQLSEALVALGGRRFVHQLAAPLLREVGERWSTGRVSIADEHLLSGTLRSLLSGLIRLREQPAGAPVVLLATPSGERHELGLMLVGLLAADAGLALHYLGPDLPAAEVATAAHRAGVAVVGLALVGSLHEDHTATEVRAIEDALPRHTELWLGGRNAGAVAATLRPSRALVLDDLGRVEMELARVRTARHPTR
jgi:MerR family transcriptional regulator, light-induced transcriptional regulator